MDPESPTDMNVDSILAGHYGTTNQGPNAGGDNLKNLSLNTAFEAEELTLSLLKCLKARSQFA